MKSITLLLVFIVTVCTCAPVSTFTTSLLSSGDSETIFKFLVEQCGPQKRKVCYDSNQMLSCYHLTDCIGTYAFSTNCDDCLRSGNSYWCSPGYQMGNTSSICTNDVGVCNFLESGVITNATQCPFGIFRDFDCNFNGVSDVMELKIYPYLDTNLDGIIDTCEQDCNSNRVYDFIDIQNGTSMDINDNHIPDECDPDCNLNGVPDDIDILYRFSSDVNRNGIPDECEIPSPSASSSPTASTTPTTSPSPTPTTSTTPSPTPSPTYIDPASSIPPQIADSPSPTTSPSPSNTPTPSVSPSVTPSLAVVIINSTCGGIQCAAGQCDYDLQKCICPEGRIGKKCEILDCNFKGIYNIFSETCSCYPGWTGINCDQCAKTLDNHPDKAYLCCPSYGEVNAYSLVLVPESRKQDFINGVYTSSKCEYPNTTFPNGDSIDCSCKFSEGPSNLSPQQMELRRSLHENAINKALNHVSSFKNGLANIIQSVDQMDTEEYNVLGLTVYQQMVLEELSQNYPIQLANAMSNNVVSFAATSSTSDGSAGIIIFAVIMGVTVVLGMIFFLILAVSRNNAMEKSKPRKVGKKSKV